jgi:hypothetical protein
MAQPGRLWAQPKRYPSMYGDRGFEKGPPGMTGTAPSGRQYDPRTDAQKTADFKSDYEKAMADYRKRSDPYGGGWGTSGSSGSSGAGGSSSGSAPEVPDMPTLNTPTYKAPEYNDRKVKAMTQMAAGPGLRSLRNQMASAMGQTYENPNVGAMQKRNVLQGYGAGLGNVMSSAHGNAVSEYGQQYASETDAARRNFDAELMASQAKYNAEMQQKQLEYEAAYRDYINAKEWAREDERYEDQKELAREKMEWEREQLARAYGTPTAGRTVTARY